MRDVTLSTFYDHKTTLAAWIRDSFEIDDDDDICVCSAESLESIGFVACGVLPAWNRFYNNNRVEKRPFGISFFVRAKNEAHNIDRCLHSLLQLRQYNVRLMDTHVLSA